jgi:cell division protein FtsW (lipid II flippase)
VVGLRRLRWAEFSLLILASATTVLGLVITNLVTKGDIGLEAVLPALVAVGALFLAHLGLAWLRPWADQVLLPVVATLVGLGLIVVWRVEPDVLPRQAMWIIVGVVVMGLIFAFPRDASWLKRYKYTWALLGIGLVGVTLVMGVDLNDSGARLWLGFNGQYFQPSEALKVLLAIFLAGYLDDRRELLSSSTLRLGPIRLPSIPHLGPIAVMWGLSVLMLVAQRDLGATLLFFGLFLALLYVASSRFIYVAGGMGLFLVGAYYATKLVSHVQTRVDLWLNPWNDIQDQAYQIVQALLAFASGGIFGVGWGYGFPDTIPAASTDYPLAVIGEQAGLAGTLALIALYLILTMRGLRIATEALEGFQQLLAVGLTSTIAIQALIIMGGNLRIIPLTGITLPFVSYGGSSLLANFIILGLLLRISHDSRKPRLADDVAALTPDRPEMHVDSRITTDDSVVTGDSSTTEDRKAIVGDQRGSGEEREL